MKAKLSNLFMKIILLVVYINSTLNYCSDRTKPILLEDNTCVMKYCTEEEFSTEKCIKDNNIIKTQWLNNIIKFGDKKTRFSKIAKYSNGDTVAIAKNEDYPNSYFYGLKENGRPLFFRDGKESPYNKLNNTSSNNNPYNNNMNMWNMYNYYKQSEEGEILVVKIGNDDEEFIINFQRLDCNYELYDFDNNYIYNAQSSLIFGIYDPPQSLNYINYKIGSIHGSLFNLKDSQNFIYAGIFRKYNYNYNYNTNNNNNEFNYYGFNYSNYFNSYNNYNFNNYLILYKMLLTTKDQINFVNNYNYNLNSMPASIVKKYSTAIEAYGNMTSCFQTEGGAHILCFYMHSLTEKKYKIITYSLELDILKPELIITSNSIDENIFFKCIFYEAEKGIFIYYDKIGNEGPYPIILFREKKAEEIKEWDKELNKVEINSYIFNTNLNFNDIIKLSKKYICFSSISTDKEILYIVLLNIFERSKVKIRYYILRTFELYHYKFYLDLRLNTYNNFLALASSYCDQKECEEDNTHYSSLIVFNYPNSIDYSKNLVDELFEKNEIIENLVFNLSLNDYVSIDNNIFGFIYSKIIIKTIENCDKINLISSKKNTEIIIDYELEKNEDIIITFNDYNLFNCTIGYIYEVTEPDYETFEEYPENKDITNGDDKAELFNREKSLYSGRLSYYNLYLNDELTNDCSNNCILCFKDQTKSCIVCDYNYNYNINELNEKQKKCSNENELTELITDEPTYKYSDQQTEILTDKITDKITDKVTDKLTDKITEKLTDKITDKLTDKFTEVLTDEITDKHKNDLTNRNTDEFIDKPTDKQTEKQVDKQEEKKECSNDEIISSQCSHGIVKNEQFSELNNEVEKKFLKEYDGEKKTIQTENIVFQMEKYNEQSEDDSLSYINLGECEKLLREECEIPEDESLIIYIVDIKSENSISTHVQYKIFHPISLAPLDYLTICSKEKISISVSVNLNNKTKSLYESLNNNGYNLFDANDSFYNDICATYTTENGTDISLNDRKNVIEESGGNLDFCQVGCKMESFNYTNKKANCNCNIIETKNISNLKDIKFSEALLLNILGGIKSSNYLVMKCYKLLLNFDLLKKNIGFIFMTTIFILMLVIFFLYIIKGRNKIEYYIQAVLKNKSIYIKNRKSLTKHENNNTSNNKILNINNSLKKGQKKKKNDIKIKRNDKVNKKKKMNGPPKKRKEKSYNDPDNLSQSYGNLNKNNIKNVNINIIPIKNLVYAKKKKKKKEIKGGIKTTKISKKNNETNIYKNKKKNCVKKCDSKGKLNNKKRNKKDLLDINYVNYQSLNIQELNILDYEIAVLVDKRTYCQYYLGLIRKKQLIIFTFFPIDDYNLVSLKIASFLLQFSLYLTVNAFFFTDDTMHQIYIDNGEMNLKYHLPQLLYTSIISIGVNIIIQNLSLSEKNILTIKKTRLMSSSIQEAKKVKILIKIKIIFFFVISFILIIFFWYFLSCFCAVYTNTQIILIKDSLISFGISMIYPFGINLMPGIFRIPALRSPKKDKKCIYEISQILSLF